MASQDVDAQADEGTRSGVRRLKQLRQEPRSAAQKREAVGKIDGRR